MTKKIIFLDHDGVLCLPQNWGSRKQKQNTWAGKKPGMSFKDIPIAYRFDDFDKEAVNILNEILEKTDAELVITSEWKNHASLEEFASFYKEQGVNKQPIAMTVGDYEFACSPEQRQSEILNWVKQQKEVIQWVAIDGVISDRLKEAKFIPIDNDSLGIITPGIKDNVLFLLG
jgi:hypothetical protein